MFIVHDLPEGVRVVMYKILQLSNICEIIRKSIQGLFKKTSNKKHSDSADSNANTRVTTALPALVQVS